MNFKEKKDEFQVEEGGISSRRRRKMRGPKFNGWLRENGVISTFTTAAAMYNV